MKTILRMFLAGSVLLAQTDSASLRVLMEDGSSAAVGRYEIEVGQAGFKTAKLSDVLINIDERRLLRVRLEVSTVNENVEVTANVASIQTEQGSLGQVITGRTAVELPLAGRRYTELALLSPGVAASTLNATTRATGRAYTFFNRNGGGLRPNRVGNPIPASIRRPIDSGFWMLRRSRYRRSTRPGIRRGTRPMGRASSILTSTCRRASASPNGRVLTSVRRYLTYSTK